jgi:ATP-binding cassette subfamily B protein
MRNVVMLSGGLILMFVSSAKLSTLVIGAVLIVMVPLILFGRWVRTLSRKSQDRIADTSAKAGETLNAVQTVQAAGAEERTVAHFRRLSERRRKTVLADRLATQALEAITANTVSIGTGWEGDGYAHETDERLKVENLFRMSRIYAHILYRLATMPA